ncbi:hydroxysqualene dehydroxylase HpnE [Pusillimonas sp. SM2304]|uniref:hydroxysqualene dehydroxylase HpnE n=1 Tax=Pusillimonas sp. SM2304 TaxID=3073241 RepID=UPI002875F194|nr:hydroxysqualene dehydroxylase HpnE [Pusillimonas sp. SM2304]MDS1142089.1 hydroxysqualene dehydroxylase HpnE [Pusillimonas sp. SM2304]
MKVAIIGGGWAGLAAAWSLHRQGHAVSVFEAARTLGGRARRVSSRPLGQIIDNGQHILLGAYTDTLALMGELGLNPCERFHRERLTLQSADGAFLLRALPLPAPLHLLGGIATARGLGPLERLRLVTLTATLRARGWKTAAGLSVAQWLEQGRQSPHALRSFWQPLCLAALNTPVDSACAQLFAHVLRDSLGGAGRATDVLIPRVDLSQLWPDEAARQLNGGNTDGAGVYLGRPVRQLACSAAGVTVDGAQFDAAVVAGNAPSARKLLEQLGPQAGSDAYLAMLSAFTYLPIATLTLQLERPWGLPQPMLLLRDDPARLQFGQWLFDRSAFAASRSVSSSHTAKQADAPRLLHIVISAASAMQQHPPAQIADAVIRQVQAQTRRFGPMPRVTGHDLIVEKRATFAATPGLARPPVATPWPRIWAAGDWTDTGYPGVLEGAVRSGRAAARSLLQSLA